mmetsp:Transcript_29413/g.50433  ORF Transcript_29413/g.50433 Transcript_29413/m.50433 type:complete len:88 (-) Transcript_29413:74-337(-)
MDSALETYLTSKSDVSGFLCIDANGLVISGKGDLEKKVAGRFTSISREAAKMHPNVQPPKIIIETSRSNILIKSYEAVTVVVKSKNT